MTIHEVTDTTFESVILGSPVPVLLDLYADWCEPCKQMSPLLEELAEEYAGQLAVCKANVEQNPMLAQAFRVRSIPMLVVFAQGRPVGQHLGALDKAGLVELVKPVVGEPTGPASGAGPAARQEVTPEELLPLLQGGQALPVDIRDEGSYGRCRIPQAVHIESSALSERATELAPTDGRVRVLYSRSTDGAKEAAAKLGELGVPVAYLVGGLLHWQADGHEVERG